MPACRGEGLLSGAIPNEIKIKPRCVHPARDGTFHLSVNGGLRHRFDRACVIRDVGLV